MAALLSVFPLFSTLILCVFNVYSMCSYSLPNRQVRLYFLAVTILCLLVNSYICICFGLPAHRKWRLFTIAIPYFLMILFVSKGKLSVNFFNFWLWVTIFSALHHLTLFVNDITFRNFAFIILLRILFLCCYFLLYHTYIKRYHKLVTEKLKINWWIFSLIPVLFTILIWFVSQYYNGGDGLSHNYLLLFVIFALMILVYISISYTFRSIYNSAQLELSQTALSQQLNAAKEQIAFLHETKMQTNIYQHDMRHHLNAIDGFLSADQPQQAKDYIRKVQKTVETIIPKRFCENELINLLCSSFSHKAEQMDIPFRVKANISKIHSISDTELCAMLSNGLENALLAVSALEHQRWVEMRCEIKHTKLLIEIRNPYSGEILMENGLPVSKKENHGYGCYSIRAIVEQHHGICMFEAENGIFTLYIALPVHTETV